MGQLVCKHCDAPIIVSTFTSVSTMPMPMINQYANTYRKALEGEPEAKDLNGNLAMCYLKLKLYDKALPAFEKAIEDNFDEPDMFFLAAVCVMKGRKAFLLQRPEIDKVEEYLNAAMMIEPKGIYHYFQAYIKLDYFKRKFFNTTPTVEEALANANAAGLSPTDVTNLYEMLGVERPSGL
jgi:tetratricopeptide (TPR) repeat protein